MQIRFYKYHGTGNDFVMVDNRNNHLMRYQPKLYAHWCDRRFGIGADGVILLQSKQGFDFEMVYYNADGFEGSMCGNGGRCAVAFAHKIGLITGNYTRFYAVDGEHEAYIDELGEISLLMQPVSAIQEEGGDFILNTGSPHYVKFVKNVDGVDVLEQGRAVRYSPAFLEKGINVNFVEPLEGGIKVATYERGVEAETFSCGTGVVASAIALAMKYGKLGNVDIVVHTKGGDLKVKLVNNHQLFTDIWLQGPAAYVFSGEISI